MQRVPLPGGGAEPPERVQGVRQAPQQDVVQVPGAQRLPRSRRLHPCWSPGVCVCVSKRFIFSPSRGRRLHNQCLSEMVSRIWYTNNDFTIANASHA
jgi:hypothetical protein